jgi:HD-like signal output (HDOD) protein
MSTDSPTPVPSAELQKLVSQKANNLVVLPAVASNAIALTKNPNWSIQEFACLIEKDPKLCTETLKLANSVLYGGGPPVLSLPQAIIRLGLLPCRNLIFSVSISSMLKSVSLEQEWICDVLWRHSFTTATACSLLNHRLKLGFQGEEFTAGLLHDFGRTLFAIADETKFMEADSLDFVDEAKTLEREREVFGIDHCDFGAWFATKNLIPDALCAVIRGHHGQAVNCPHEKLVALTAAADHIANHLQRLGDIESYDATENHGIGLLDTLLGTNLAQRFDEHSPEILNEILSQAQQPCSSSAEGQ